MTHHRTDPAPTQAASPARGADDGCITPEVPDPSIALAEWQLCMLRELAEIGMELARDLRPRFLAMNAAAEEATRRDPAVSFARISRAIRLTFTVQNKVDKALRDLRAGVAEESERRHAEAVQRDEAAVEGRRKAHVDRIRGLVMEVADAEHEDIEDYDDVHEAMDERLEHDNVYADCADRPVREVVERLCADLGLSPDWSQWAGEGWALNASGRPPRSPYNQPSPKSTLVRFAAEAGRPEPPA